MSRQVELKRMLNQGKIKRAIAETDITKVMQSFPDLTPTLKWHSFPSGEQSNAFCLRGTVPLRYKGNVYHIPIFIVFRTDHPYQSPLIYVDPTPSMTIRESATVKPGGRVEHPYANSWSYPRTDTLTLLRAVVASFEEKCPVFSKTSTASATVSPATTNSNPPYPGGVSAAETPYPIANSFPSAYTYTPPLAGGGYQPQNAGYQPPYPSPYGPPPIPPRTSVMNNYSNAIHESLITALEEKIAKRMINNHGPAIDEIQRLDISLNEMNTNQLKLRQILERADAEQRNIDHTIEILQRRKADYSGSLKSVNQTSEDEEPIDSAIDAYTPLYKQIFENYAMHATMDDSIYHLTEALHNGAITLPAYLTQVRKCSRAKFLSLLFMNKGREVAGLPQITG